MAEIDKALPNVRQTINVPSQEDVAVAEQEKLIEQQDAGQPVEQIEINENHKLVARGCFGDALGSPK